MRTLLACSGIALLLGVTPVAAGAGGIAPLAAQTPPLPRAFAITAGLGNAHGWLGVQGERYFTNDRLSAFAAAGYTPELDPGDPSGLSFAAGARGYTGGTRHRAFLEASVSQILLELAPEPGRRYGPGLQVGYQYVAHGGFTGALSFGFGYAPGVSTGGEVAALLGLGLGYTWRR